MADYIIAKAQEGLEWLIFRPWVTISVVVILALLVHL